MSFYHLDDIPDHLKQYFEPAPQIGLEKSPELYVQELVQVFREVWRVLKKDGTVWLNIGDSYAANRGYQVPDSKHVDVGNNMGAKIPVGLKPKDLIGIPWRIAFALQADEWWLRQDIIWHKPNPMPESVTDRCTKSHEYLFLLTKSAKYFYNADAIKEPSKYPLDDRKSRSIKMPDGWDTGKGSHGAFHRDGREKGQKRYPTKSIAGIREGSCLYEMRNKRSVWCISTQAYSAAHFATFPEKLVEPCILAGSKPGDVVLDPFAGSCTAGKVAERHGREFVGIELNWDYIGLAKKRMAHNQCKLI